MPGKSIFEPLAEPFFTLEYDPESAAFIRKIPAGAEDLKGGRFRYRGRLFVLGKSPGGEEAPLRQRTLGGREILAMARRGYGPLVRSGPIPAERGERLMELALKTAPPGMRRPDPGRGMKRPAAATAAAIASSSITILLVYKVPKEKWLPLEGLPNYRLFQNRIYEIIPAETLSSLFSGGPGGYEESGAHSPALTLKGAGVPAFADLHARLVYVFAEPPLYRLLSQENLFIPGEKLSLVLRCAPVTERGVGRAVAAPFVKYNKKLFSALTLSRRFRSAYIALEDKWVRRETLEQKGIGPLGRYINGESLEPFGVTAGSLFVRDRGELRTELRGLWEDFEFDRDRWRRYGSEKEIFSAHLEFLRAWGVSGGIVSGDREKTAAFLAGWLKSLAAELERTAPEPEDLFDAPLPGRVLVLMQQSFWGKWLEKELPQSGEGPRTVPAGKYSGASSLGDPRFRGIGLGFYRDFLKAHGGEAGWDMLILVGPEEALYSGESFDRDLFRALAAIKTRLRLGVFFSAGFLSPFSPGSGFPGSKELSPNPHKKEIKSLFGLRGNLGKIEKYLVRETGDLLSPPPVKPRPPPVILRPSSPWGGKAPMGDETFFVIGGGRFFTETRFRGLQSAEYRIEQECFSRRGTSTNEPLVNEPLVNEPLVNELLVNELLVNEPLVRGLGGGFRERKRRPPQGLPEPDFNRLSPEDREWFFRWRSEFREGRNRETSLTFLLLYTRELVLLMGGRPEEAFDELLRLWKVYREIYPSLDGRFPKWLLDFAILYKTGEKTVSPALLGFPPQEAGLAGDLYLHKKYVEENNSLVTADFEDLLPGGRSRAFSRLDFSAGLRERARDAFGVILNTIDRFLRQFYGKKLLEFFYPLPPQKETVAAFEGLAGLGNSAYTAEWLSFSAHRPFLSFLSSIAALLEYRLLKENGFNRLRSPPRLAPLWKYLAGLDDPGDPAPEELDLPQVELEKEKISRLRTESDAVRDLLHIEKEEEIPPSPFSTPNSSLLPPNSSLLTPNSSQLLTPNSSLHTFLAELSEPERAALELIAAGGGRKDIEELAREKGTMADLILDGINGRFMEDRGDLLLEISPDDEPRIQAEYRDEVLRHTKAHGD
jgi:hypothetical protein